MVTRFTYRTPDAEITSVQLIDETVRIDFSVLGTPSAIDVEAAVNAAGPDSIEESAQVTMVSDNKMEASVPVSTKNRFFRIRLD